MKLFFQVFPLFSIGMAIWMILDTKKTFPGDSFQSLIPGYIIFPGLMIIIAVVCWFIGPQL